MSQKSNLSLFLMDGTLDGRIRCHKGYGSFIAYKIPRTMVNTSVGDNNLQNSGIYFLFGRTTNEDPCIYVGQANNRKNGKGLLCRVQEHLKEEWTEAILITTSDNAFGPTEISYLENYFCILATEAKRYIVRNSNEPNIGNPTEEMVADLADVIEFTKLMVGVLGHKAFEPLAGKTTKSSILSMTYKGGGSNRCTNLRWICSSKRKRT